MVFIGRLLRANPEPIGPLVASAVASGLRQKRDGAPTPYRGYYYHILTVREKMPGRCESVHRQREK